MKLPTLSFLFLLWQWTTFLEPERSALSSATCACLLWQYQCFSSVTVYLCIKELLSFRYLISQAWDMIPCNEAHSCPSIFQTIVPPYPFFDRVYCISLPNTCLDSSSIKSLWDIVVLRPIFSTKWAVRTQFGAFTTFNDHWDWEVGKKNLNQLISHTMPVINVLATLCFPFFSR